MFYEEFFGTIGYLLSIAKEKDRQALIRGENYNVFDIIGLTSNEVKLHSSFIADLLNPRGLHGLGIKPLKHFFDILNLHMKDEDLSAAEVTKEYHNGNISDDYTWGGNIDILRPHSIKSVNARVADVPRISLCIFRSIAGYVTESKSDRRGAAARIRYF